MSVDLEHENAVLKRMLADAELRRVALVDAAARPALTSGQAATFLEALPSILTTAREATA